MTNFSSPSSLDACVLQRAKALLMTAASNIVQSSDTVLELLDLLFQVLDGLILLLRPMSVLVCTCRWSLLISAADRYSKISEISMYACSRALPYCRSIVCSKTCGHFHYEWTSIGRQFNGILNPTWSLGTAAEPYLEEYRALSGATKKLQFSKNDLLRKWIYWADHAYWRAVLLQ